MDIDHPQLHMFEGRGLGATGGARGSWGGSGSPDHESRLDHLVGDANVYGLPTYDGDFRVGLEACRV